jgi:hypothetical protein
VDELWTDLYDCEFPQSDSDFANKLKVGTTGISKVEADKLVNATLSAPLDQDTYLVELSVVHDLHCLNRIRKAVYADQYPDILPRKADGSIDRESQNSFHIGKAALIETVSQLTVC